METIKHPCIYCEEGKEKETEHFVCSYCSRGMCDECYEILTENTEQVDDFEKTIVENIEEGYYHEGFLEYVQGVTVTHFSFMCIKCLANLAKIYNKAFTEALNNK